MSEGPATDQRNEPVIDPTQNVLDKVASEVRRLDDLAALRAFHQEKVGSLRAEYDDRLRRAESDRIDAIRAVDVGNVQRAAEVQATQALTLANQVTTSAEALRVQVTATATAAGVALAAALEPIIKDIAELRKVQYETAGGKAQTTESREVGGSRGMWLGVAVAAFFGFTGLLIGVAGIAIVLLR